MATLGDQKGSSAETRRHELEEPGSLGGLEHTSFPSGDND